MDAQLRAAGFDPEGDACREAVCYHRSGCDRHYTPVHLQDDPHECPTCEATAESSCRHCQAAGVV